MKVTINMFCDRLLADNKMDVLTVALHARKLDNSIKLETVQAIHDAKFTLDSHVMFMNENNKEDKAIFIRLTNEYNTLLSQGKVL